jgi:DNA repair photolyase
MFEERKQSLKYAYERGFRTSVSMEPMLDTIQIEQLIETVRPFVTEDIWLGTMNHLKGLKKTADEALIAEIDKVEAGQTPEILIALYNTYKDDPLIKWKTDALKNIKGCKDKSKKQ